MKHALAALLAGLVLAAAALTPVAAGGRAAATPGWAGCRAFFRHAPVLLHRPRSIMVACGDGNLWLGGLRWTAWSTTRAEATGTAHENDCTPYCAAGHFHTYPVAVTLGGVKTCNGRTEFTRLVYRFPAAKPKGPRSGSIDFRCA